MTKRLLAFAIAIMMVAMLAVGCAQTPTTPQNTNSPADSSQPENSNEPAQAGNDDVKYKDTIIFATATEQNYMDGQMNNSNDMVLRTVYSSLVMRDSENNIVGDLADHWETSEDGLVWTFYLRQDVKWHNGKQFTSADVKASYDRLLNAENPVRYTSTMSIITGCNVVDDYTIELTTADPCPMMLATLCHRANLILDADYIEKYGTELGLTAESCNGTGPYVLKQWDMGEQMVFEAFHDYFKGEAPTKNLIIQVMPEASSRAVALETHEVDMAEGCSSQDVLRFMEEGADMGIVVNFYSYQGLHGFQFNCAHPIIKDTKIRQAISYAIDREAMIDALYAPIGEYCATAPLSEVVWGYYNFGVIKQDLEKSKQLLAEAGYPDGFEFSIQVYEGYNNALASAEMIVADLAKVGITATIEVVDNAAFKAARANRTYPGEDFPWGMFIMGFGPGTLDADEGLRRIWETSYKGDNNNNYGWYSNSKVDELLNKAKVEMDEETRKELYKEAMQIIYIDDPAAVFTNQRKIIFCMSDKVEGFQVDMRKAVNYTTLKCRE